MREHPVLDPPAVAVASDAMPTKAQERHIAERLEALCSPVRLKILRALVETPLSSGDLAIVIERSRAATSQHLRMLREAGVVRAERRGNVVRYRLDEGVDARALAEVARHLADGAPAA